MSALVSVTIGILALVPVRESVAGYASFIIDNDTGVVLYQVNADTLNYPASLTKMMTLYLAFEALEAGTVTLDTDLTVSAFAAKRPPSKLGLKAGSTIKLGEAIRALAIKSANDVATVVAENLGGSEKSFAIMMTKRARELGMTRTTYRNASGLPDRKQRTTARDIATLSRQLYARFPQYTHYFNTQTFKYGGRQYRNTNRLLGVYRGMDGIKTGYINASGFNLAASVRRKGHHIIAIVLGGKTAIRRDRHMRQLLDDSFRGVKRINRIMAVVKRPRFKPNPDVAMAAVAPPTKGETRDARPDRFDVALAVGDAISSYVAIPSAQAHQELDRNWAIQVGAYSRIERAEQALDAAAFVIPALITETARSVDTVIDEHGPLYRARQSGLTEAEARRACQELKAQSLPCLVAGPKS
jgi:D-alanyl-D-alanine carboxypeptidase